MIVIPNLALSRRKNHQLIFDPTRGGLRSSGLVVGEKTKNDGKNHGKTWVRRKNMGLKVEYDLCF